MSTDGSTAGLVALIRNPVIHRSTTTDSGTTTAIPRIHLNIRHDVMMVPAPDA
jgi:hypothetical protein